eukprot:CAMPEP_0197433550 /NCGR_PEP_ID=MMETSP1175-20131217/1419_1 /TAXON_ID=1003142 /ORGANISM="Triceratium dubium, Strain CCMP147" /LENGTH=618 /DNA_ID=CAMNT_0042961967 /DNA_START=53 /DNA_END=1909 /DNA_ORIENTATION=+
MSVFTTSRAIRVASAGVVQRSSTAISSSRRVSLSSVASSALRFHCRAASSVVQNGSGSIRFQSSATATAEAPGCRHAAAASKSKQLSTQADIDVATAVGCPVHSTKPGGPSSNDHPELVEVPSLPFVGSLVRSYSNIPPLDKPYTFWPEMRKKYGDFYSMGMPGLGNPDDSKNTVYIVQDPKEMMKVLRSEGSLPSGMAQSSWAIAKWERDAGFEIVSHDDGGFLGQGENWKRIRTFMQTDLLHPTAARGYADGIIEAAELASKGAPASSKDMNAFFERCAFDMFSTVMFGHNMECADPNTSTDLEDLEFVRAAKIGLGTSGAVSRSLRDAIFVKTFGIETEQFRKMKENLDLAWKIGSDKIERFLERREKRELSEREKKSYLFRAMERYEQGSSGVSLQEAKEMSWGGIFAAVDTTSGKMGWNVLHAALNPGVQERLYKEISTATSSNGGRLTPEILDRSKTPFLHAFVRESHRLTPVVPIATRKRVASDNLTIHGVTLPRGSAVACDGFSLGQDPSYVDEPRSFRPERWLDDAVASRKGTPKELIDHPFFKGPFSQGARNCPGSRVALNEVTVILSQLLLDYRISAPGVSSLDDVAYAQHTVLEPRMPSLHFEPRA